jgi:hypothetical protein
MVKAFNSSTVPYMILGLPFFSAFHIVLDKGKEEITFSPGCGCNTKDKYPIILTDNQYKFCKSSTLGTGATSTNAIPSTSTSSKWTCQSYTPWLPATTVTASSSNNSNDAVGDRVFPVVSLVFALILSLTSL